MACLRHAQKRESLISTIVASYSYSILEVIDLSCLIPEGVVIIAEYLHVSHPDGHGKWAILLIVPTGVDKHIQATVQCQHAIIEMCPVNILLRLYSIIDSLRTRFKYGFL